jgi:hypothetical protein
MVFAILSNLPELAGYVTSIAVAFYIGRRWERRFAN